MQQGSLSGEYLEEEAEAEAENGTLKTATALGKLGHPDGEVNLTRAAAKYGIIQMVCVYIQSMRSYESAVI